MLQCCVNRVGSELDFVTCVRTYVESLCTVSVRFIDHNNNVCCVAEYLLTTTDNHCASFLHSKLL